MRGRFHASRQVAMSYALLLAGLLAVGIGIVAPPFSQRLVYFERLRELRAVESRVAATLAESRGLFDKASAEPAAAEEASSLLQGETAPLAAAELQDRVRRVVERAGGVLVNSAFRSRPDPSPLTPVSVDVRLRCSIQSLTDVLHGLEALEPALFVDNLSVQSNHRAGRTLRELSGELDVQLEITGYLDRPSEP